MKKPFHFAGLLVLCASPVFAEEQASSSPAWGLSVQGLSNAYFGVRYKKEASAWQLSFGTYGDSEQDTTINGAGRETTSDEEFRGAYLGLAWRRYFSAEPVRFLVQPELYMWKYTYDYLECEGCPPSYSSSRDFGVSLSIGAEVFLSPHWSIEGLAGLNYRNMNLAHSSYGGSESLDPEQRDKEFRSTASLATTFYWEPKK